MTSGRYKSALYFPALISLLLILQVKPAAAQNQIHPIGLNQLLNELIDVPSLPVYFDRTVCAQVSSYDTTGGNDDGFSGKYSYLRRTADSSLIIFDLKGPGVINRIWTPTPSEDSLAFYIDDLAKPAFTIRYKDLFTGKVFPFVHPLCNNQLGGYYCYLPISFQVQCRIVYKGTKTQFHQIQYRSFLAGTPVTKFSLPLQPEETLLLKRIDSLWSHSGRPITDSFPDDNLRTETKAIQLRPGQQENVIKLTTGGRIMGLEIESSDALEATGKQIDIRISWDDDRVPAVFCPLVDFFGYASGKPSMKSLLVGAQGQRSYCYFPMPFDKAARIELLYRKPEHGNLPAVTFQSRVTYSTKKRNPEREGRFYSWWSHTNPTEFHQPHVFLKTNGRGHYVGTVLEGRGLYAGMTYFFEGDDSTAVDGQFRMHGTGSEDYFNGGWYALPDRWDSGMSLPLSGALEYSLPFCRTGGYRLFLSDKISFEKSIYHSIEHGPTNNIKADYTSVGYYYCSQGPESVSIPDNAGTKIVQPDTLMVYPQLMNFGMDEKMEVSTSWAYPTGGQTYSFTVVEGAGLRIPLPIPPGTYRLFLDDVTGPDAYSVSVWQRQTQLTDWMDRHSSMKKREPLTYLCRVQVDELVNTITFRFKAPGHQTQFILNRLILVRD